MVELKDKIQAVEPIWVCIKHDEEGSLSEVVERYQLVASYRLLQIEPHWEKYFWHPSIKGLLFGYWYG